MQTACGPEKAIIHSAGGKKGEPENKKASYQSGRQLYISFFWQHGEEEAVLREYMKVIDESNIKAVCVESRPHPDFCGPNGGRIWM